MKILIDANILLDVALEIKLFFSDSERISVRCSYDSQFQRLYRQNYLRLYAYTTS